MQRPQDLSRKTVVFVRLDAIGDFVLWSSTFEALRRLYPKDEYRWVLIGNSAWKTLAECMNLFDQILSINTNHFRKNLSYRRKSLREIRSLPVNVVLHPTFSRDFLVADTVVRFLDAPVKIGSTGDLSNILSWEKNISDSWYTELSQSPYEKLSELERHAEFVAHLAKTSPAIKYPDLKSCSFESKVGGDLSAEPYFVLFPGASWAGRRWPLKNFLSVAKKIQDETHWLGVICGASEDLSLMKDELEQLQQSLGPIRLKNLMGQTSLPELTGVLRNSRLLISNETSAVHIGASVGTPTVCILGGGHFGRFAPWKNEKGDFISNPLCVWVDMPCFGCNWNCIYERGKVDPVKCIADISIDRVYKSVQELLER